MAQQKNRKGTTSRKKTVPAKKSSGKQAGRPSERLPARYFLAPFFFLLGVLALFSCFTTNGFILGGIKEIICGLVGPFCFYLSPALFGVLFWLTLTRYRKRNVSRCVSAVLAWILMASVVHLLSQEVALPAGIQAADALFDAGVAGNGGGLFGGLIGLLFQSALAQVLAIIVLGTLCCLAVASVCNITLTSLARAIRNRPRPEIEEEEWEDPATVVVNHIANKRLEHLDKKRRVEEFDIPVDDTPLERAKPISERRKSAVRRPDQVLEEQLKEQRSKNKREEREEAFDDEPITGSTVIPPAAPEDMDAPASDVPQDGQAPAVPQQQTPETVTPVVEVLPVTPPAEESVRTELEDYLAENREPAVPEPTPTLLPAAQPALEKVTAEKARESAMEVAQEIAQQAQVVRPEYRFPPVSLLKSVASGAMDGTVEMRENSKRLSEALQSFKIEARICNVTRGPSVTRYEVELAQGVRLAKVTALQDDLALALGATGVRISAIPDKIAVVGIEVPNKLVTTVALREVIDSPQFSKAKSKSSFAVGKDIGGTCVVGDISKLPHMLIAGTTGSGKSVCMNSIIISLLYKARPEDVKLIMVDPKMVELGIYNGIPHLLIPVVTDPKKAAGSLQWAVTEMMRRYKTMSDAGVRDLESFNRIVESAGEGEPLPQIVVIIDELADLMLVAAKEVEESICRIAQMGRAAGMHLIIATQRPSADVITGLMKANIPSRIAFAVASAMESRIILDTQGAEKLVGRGDMLYAPLGKGKPKRIQGCFVSDPEVEAVTEYVKAHYNADYSQDVLEEIERKAEQSGKGGKGNDLAVEFSDDVPDGDELLPAAVDIILETGQASVSMLQRRLKLGYARAARIVDEMEEKGIVGPFMGSKPRTILITKEQWKQMQSGDTPMTCDEADDGVPELMP